MSVLLASMLESIGGKTVLIEWFEKSKSDPSKTDGHEFIGILISDDPSESKRSKAMEKAGRRIIDRYYNRVRTGSTAGIVFFDMTINGKKETFLSLDATYGNKAIPGLADHRWGKERVYESRPGAPGFVPDL